jgi:hypothetical protein
MRTLRELDDLRKQAVLLRRQGKSLRQIKEILGPVSNATLHDALRGEPPPEWTRRPNAKDGLRAGPASCATKAWTTRKSPLRSVSPRAQCPAGSAICPCRKG